MISGAQSYNFKYTTMTKAFSKNYEKRISGFSKEIKQFISVSDNKENLDVNSTKVTRQEPMKPNDKENKEKINYFGPKESTKSSIVQVSRLLNQDTSDKLYHYLSFLGSVLFNLNQGVNNIDYTKILNEYRGFTYPTHKLFGYSLRVLPLEDKNSSGEIIVTRFQTLLGRILDTPIDLNNTEQFKKAFSNFIVKLADNGYKYFHCLHFTGLDFSNQTFEGCNFGGASLRNTNLSNTKFINCDLEGANLKGAKLDSCIAQNSELERMKFDNLQQASELIIQPPIRNIDRYWFVDRSHREITRSRIFAFAEQFKRLNEMERSSLVTEVLRKRDTGEFEKHNIHINLLCSLTLTEYKNFTDTCAIRYPASTGSNAIVIKFFNAKELWEYFKLDPSQCPERVSTDKLIFLQLNDIRELTHNE